jgi:hypothetical protein
MPGCTVNKEKSGGKEDVKINTPIGGLHVSTDADVKDVGLALFPGALVKPDKDGDKNRANVNINTSLFGVKVVALEYTSDAAPEKVAEFYRKELAKYGSVLECPGQKRHVNVSFSSGNDDGAKPLTCDKNNQGTDLELKAGDSSNQHVVSIKPAGKGTEFALVHVMARGGKEAL